MIPRFNLEMVKAAPRAIYNHLPGISDTLLTFAPALSR